jgi:hypothetical protein
MEAPNLLRAINPRHNPTQATINRILKPLGLRLSLTPVKKLKHSSEKRSNPSPRRDIKGPFRASASCRILIYWKRSQASRR